MTVSATLRNIRPTYFSISDKEAFTYDVDPLVWHCAHSKWSTYLEHPAILCSTYLYHLHWFPYMHWQDVKQASVSCQVDHLRGLAETVRATDARTNIGAYLILNFEFLRVSSRFALGSLWIIVRHGYWTLETKGEDSCTWVSKEDQSKTLDCQ